MSFDALTRHVLERARKDGVMIATAESCTGGMVATALTEVAGSSEVFERGFVTYSNDAKQELLGVAEALIEEQGAVSELVARAMAEGAVARSNATLSVAITGIAGPSGGSVEKPVGLVYIATAYKDAPTHAKRYIFTGNRKSVRRQAVEITLKMLLARLEDG